MHRVSLQELTRAVPRPVSQWDTQDVCTWLSLNEVHIDLLKVQQQGVNGANLRAIPSHQWRDFYGLSRFISGQIVDWLQDDAQQFEQLLTRRTNNSPHTLPATSVQVPYSPSIQQSKTAYNPSPCHSHSALSHSDIDMNSSNSESDSEEQRQHGHSTHPQGGHALHIKGVGHGRVGEDCSDGVEKEYSTEDPLPESFSSDEGVSSDGSAGSPSSQISSKSSSNQQNIPRQNYSLLPKDNSSNPNNIKNQNPNPNPSLIPIPIPISRLHIGIGQLDLSQPPTPTLDVEHFETEKTQRSPIRFNGFGDGVKREDGGMKKKKEVCGREKKGQFLGKKEKIPHSLNCPDKLKQANSRRFNSPQQPLSHSSRREGKRRRQGSQRDREGSQRDREGSQREQARDWRDSDEKGDCEGQVSQEGNQRNNFSFKGKQDNTESKPIIDPALGKMAFSLLMQKKLKIKTDNGETTVSGNARIGRTINHDIEICDSTVSRNHAEIVVWRGPHNQKIFALRDVGSKFGTFVQCRGPHQLSVGQVYMVGTLEMEVLALEICRASGSLPKSKHFDFNIKVGIEGKPNKQFNHKTQLTIGEESFHDLEIEDSSPSRIWIDREKRRVFIEGKVYLKIPHHTEWLIEDNLDQNGTVEVAFGLSKTILEVVSSCMNCFKEPKQCQCLH